MVLYDFNTQQSVNQDYPGFIKDVLGKKPFILLVHAEWCGHCKHLMEGDKPWPTAVKANQSSDIVQIESKVFDHLKDKHPDLMFARLLSESVQGYPYIASVEANVPIDVSEANLPSRTTKDLDAFIKAHTPKKKANVASTAKKTPASKKRPVKKTK